MPEMPIREIVEDRLKRWAEKLVKEHATPLVLVGVSHEHLSGQVVICTIEDPGLVDVRMIQALLRKVIMHLDRPQG